MLQKVWACLIYETVGVSMFFHFGGLFLSTTSKNAEQGDSCYDKEARSELLHVRRITNSCVNVGMLVCETWFRNAADASLHLH